MSKNIKQVYDGNPITTNAGTDLMYFGQSPYGATNDAAMLYSNFLAQLNGLFPNGTVVVTAATQTIANGTVYVADGVGIVTFTLPSSVVGAFFAIIGVNGWQLNLSNGQVVTIGNITANGSSSQNWNSLNNNDTVIIECIGANSWQAVSIAGNPISAGRSALPPGFVQSNSVTSSSQAMTVNNIYWCNNGASLITYTLPTTNLNFLSSSKVRVYGDSSASSGGWKITYGTGVVIRYGQNASTATTGFIQSTNPGDGVELTYIQGTEWLVTGVIGSPKLDTGGNLIGLTSVNNGVLKSDSTGNPSFSTTLPSGLSATNLTLTTPTLGAATATSVAFSPTTGGIIGTTAADNAGAGKVGEYVTSNLPATTPISLSNNTAADITSISLTAGDWDIFGNVTMQFDTTTVVTNKLWWTSTSSATLPADNSLEGNDSNHLTGNINNMGSCTPYLRVNVNTTTTVYLSCYCSFTTSFAHASGSIFARRVR